MPELPDIEGFRRLFRTRVTGKQVISVKVLDSGVVRAPSSKLFARKLKDRRFTDPDRRGKWLLAPTDGSTLLFHFGMTGTLAWDSLAQQFQRFDRVAISFDDGKLVYRDQRKLGGLWLAHDEDEIREIIGDQGPDALGLSGRRLEQRLEGRRSALKTTLMDQSVLAGIGNTLSDEVLWRAKIHPQRRFGDLGRTERHQLDLDLQRVLRASVKKGAIPRLPSWLSSQRSLPKSHCPRCHARLKTSRVGGRTSYWCPVCQPRPAD